MLQILKIGDRQKYDYTQRYKDKNPCNSLEKTSDPVSSSNVCNTLTEIGFIRSLSHL